MQDTSETHVESETLWAAFGGAPGAGRLGDDRPTAAEVNAVAAALWDDPERLEVLLRLALRGLGEQQKAELRSSAVAGVLPTEGPLIDART